MKRKGDHPIKILFSFAGEAKGKMTLSVILAVIGELFGMAPFFAVAILANQVYAGTATVKVAAIASGAAVICVCIRAFFTLRSSLRSHGISFTILKNIRCAIADKMRRVPMGVMLETPSGNFKTLLVDNVGRLEDIIAHMIPEFPSNLAAPLANIILVYILDWRMGLAALITVPLSVVFIIGMLRGHSEKMAVHLQAGNEMNTALVEYVGGIQVIKAFGRTGESFGRFSKSVNYFFNSTMAWWKQCWFWMAGFKAVLPSTILGTLPIGALLYLNDRIELPIFLVCIIIPIGFISGFMRLGFGIEQLSYLAANLNPILDFLAIPGQQRPKTSPSLKERAYTFKNVNFSYDNENKVLHDISFSTKPGSFTALVGPSGSGKSTIAKLMAGYWDATSGNIEFGGYNLKDIPFDLSQQPPLQVVVCCWPS